MFRFLLVSLNIKAILQETTLSRRREKLEAMRSGLGLGDAYDATIGRIKAQEGDRAQLGITALMWISHSERPLNVDEICHAIAVEIGSNDISTNNIPSIRKVLSCCQGLATVDTGSSTIKLIHPTLKIYLSGQSDLFNGAHSKIAETCLTYLNFRAIKNLSASPSRTPRDTPLLEYSSLYWGTHMQMELSDCSISLALDLLNQYNNHISAELLWKSTVEWYFRSQTPFSALHCISYFGIAEVANNLIKTKRWDVNQRDSAGLTPLMWAARRGHEEVVKLLLQEKDTQPNIPDTDSGRTVLAWAARNGRDRVVELVLGREDVNLDQPDSYGHKPLWLAARNGYDGAVRLLLGREGISPDRPDNHGQTLLSWAAEAGNYGIVKLLLEREDVNPNRLGNRGQTLLLWAAQNGRDRIVNLLLGREGANPDRPDNHGQTPLSWAARNGRDGVVDLLLGEEGVNPDRPDNGGQTPLSWAARNGHDRVVNLLLEREDVNPDRPDNGGQTPLSWAARNGHDGVVKLLLEREDVNPDRPDNSGKIPLWWAAWHGHDGVVKLFLEWEYVRPR